MDLPSSADEGEPAKTIIRFSKIVIAFLLLTSPIACRQKKEVVIATPKVDSIAIKLEQLHKADSMVHHKKPTKKIYITFDDGPNKGTLNVLKVVKEENITASFFIVGKHVFDSPQQTAVWEELKADSSIELCNHSYTHALNKYAKFYQEPLTVINDFEQNHQLLQLDNKVVRMPGRNAWRIDSIDVTDIYESKVAIDSVHHAGFEVLGWDIEWNFDHKTLTPDADTALLLRRIHNLLQSQQTKTAGHLVLLAHDQSFQKVESIEMLRFFLRELKNDAAYEFMIASEYPGIKK